MSANLRRQQAIRKQVARRRGRVQRRLDKRDLRGCDRPALTARGVRYEVAERCVATAYGGIAALHELARLLELPEAINARLHLLQLHLPYFESDHVLNLAYNALCGGTCLDDLELRRQDEAYLDALGARRIPDPTTAGDFCRRFDELSLRVLQDAFHHVRKQVWAQQPAEFFAQAIVELDGVFVETGGACKQGIDINYKNQWCYHPLIMSLANTGEVLSILNRAGNRPSYEGAAAEVEHVLPVLFDGGFQRVLLRGDTDFTQTKELDRWDADGRVTFIFGMDVRPHLHVDVDDLPASAWTTLDRPAKYLVKTQPRARPENAKQPIVVERGFKDIRLVGETVAEMKYQPAACAKEYRLVIVRKDLSVEQHGARLFADYRYFFYLTNDWKSTAEDIVFSANDRCNQENIHAQLKSGVRSLYAPVDTLLANGAWMVMTALAWNLKSWYALMLPQPAGEGAVATARREEQRCVLRMEFRTFVNAFVRVPCQVLRSGRRLICRVLAWNRWQDIFFRAVDRLALPLDLTPRRTPQRR